MTALCEHDPDLLENFEFTLMEHQQEALDLLGNGRILYGGVGAGKSAVAASYYILKEAPRDVYVITTAKKRDALDWQKEFANVCVGYQQDASIGGELHIDSWNNIGTYKDVRGAFFIFDEQRLVGSGAWAKSFQKIARNNHWIMLTATPGDTWMDYAQVFIANGWYTNISDFKRQHVVYAPFVKFPIIQGYLGEDRLERLRDTILVEMPYSTKATRNINYMTVGYDEAAVKSVLKYRWNIYENKPIQNIGELWRVIRRIVYSDPSRLEMIRFLLKMHDRLIIFYTFDYELEILRNLQDQITVAEWNGHRKQPIPDTDKWAYLVQYTSGSEGWNCITTDSICMYSLNYSYKHYIQCQGRIDRLDTPYTLLYYYVLVSNSKVDRGVKRSLGNKKSFNEREEFKKLGESAFV